MTRMHIQQDLTLSGALARYGRGMISDATRKLTRQFADCLKADMSPGPPQEARDEAAAGPPSGDGRAAERAAPARAQARPVSGLRLGLWALGRAIARLVERIFGRRAGA